MASYISTLPTRMPMTNSTFDHRFASEYDFCTLREETTSVQTPNSSPRRFSRSFTWKVLGLHILTRACQALVACPLLTFSFPPSSRIGVRRPGSSVCDTLLPLPSPEAQVRVDINRANVGKAPGGCTGRLWSNSSV